MLVLFAAVLGIGVLELYVVIKVGEAIGVLPTLALMVLDALIGSALMRSQGRAVWRRMREALAAGRVPAGEVLDGVLVLVGGAFLIAPGFVTDVIGALLLVPPTRALTRRAIVRRLARRLTFPATATTRARHRAGDREWDGEPEPTDVEGSAIELDRHELRP